MRVCNSCDNAKQGYFNAFQVCMYRKCTVKKIFYKMPVFLFCKNGTFQNMRGLIGGGGLSSNRYYYRRSTVAGMGTAFPSTGYQITAARSIVQQTLLQTVYRCGEWVQRSHQQAIR